MFASEEPLSSLRLAVSQERLEPYRHEKDADDLEAFGRYTWNVLMSEALYPTLQGLEVTLRNSIHRSATVAFGDEFWLVSEDGPLQERERITVNRAKKKLSQNNKEITPGRLVAELNLGFWTGLLQARYEQVLWPKLIGAFPHVPRRLRYRKALEKRLNDIRKLRNRVFHYEPIWHWKDINHQHDNLLEAIGWISPAVETKVKMMDRFQEIYDQGHEPCRDRLSNLFDDLNRG